MSEEVNNAISEYLKNSSNVKEEYQNEYYPYNKVFVSETTVNIRNIQTNGYIKNDKKRKYEMLSVDHIKTELLSSEVNDTISNNAKIEDGIYPANILTEFHNELLFCNHCHEVYQDYCTKCRVLVHILNRRHSYNAYSRVRELPKDMLETRESIGYLGIFSLKVIPEDVKFGPFTGLISTGLPLKIKGGRFVVSDDKVNFLNWMQYINPAGNIYEGNLYPFQYEDKLYYCSSRRIEEGEELLVYFGGKYENNLLENTVMDFVPITKEGVENVFACTSCCLGFRWKEYLAEHKAMFHRETNEMFTVEELAQCPFCKIYLEAKEYFEHHMEYCRETNDRYCVFLSPEVHQLEVRRRVLLRSKVKRWKRGIYKCTQCKFRTMYNADYRHHTNEHYKVKMYKCGICYRRYKTKESLKAHVAKIHANFVGKNVSKYFACDYFKAYIKNTKEGSSHTLESRKQCQRSEFQSERNDKCHLKSLIKIKHPNRGKYKCSNCEFRTYYRTYLEMHLKTKHFMESNYSCAECEFETKHRSSLERHTKAKHLIEINYKCTECEFKTNNKSYLNVHTKAKHLKLRDYKCMECDYKTYYKSDLTRHMNAKHLNENNYKCMECEFKTNYKAHLNVHMKAKHLKENDYKCMECNFKTYYKSDLERHMNAKHLNENSYKCTECEFCTNYKAHLNVHIKAKHLKESDYKCTECEFKTKYKSHLNVHIKAKHLKEKNYKCMECEYKTNYKRVLEEHIKTRHLKVSDYKCTECEFKTNYKSNLHKHIKAKHLREKDYECAECEYKTSRKSDLERHRKARHLKEGDYKCVEDQFKTSHIKKNTETMKQLRK